MNKMILVLLAAFVMCGVAYASEQTSTDRFDQGGISYEHSHSVDVTPAFGAGIGADLVVYKGPSPLLEEVVIENRYDMVNGEARIFAVGRFDLFDALRK